MVNKTAKAMSNGVTSRNRDYTGNEYFSRCLKTLKNLNTHPLKKSVVKATVKELLKEVNRNEA